MPPRTLQKRPAISRSRGSDPTVSIASAASARNALNSELQQENEQSKKEQENNQQPEKTNDDLKKLIETLKSKLGTNPNAAPQKKVPPTPQSKTPWNRSVSNPSAQQQQQQEHFKPAYTVLTRISNHEKVPAKSIKAASVTINSMPHSFLYKPGKDGIKVDGLNIKAGKQLGMG